MLSELNVQYMVNKNSAAVLIGEESRIYTSDQPEFQQVKDLVAAGDELGLVKLVRGLKDFVAKLPYVGFTVRENIVFINDEAVPAYFGRRLKEFADSGSPYEYLIKFWDNLKKNPSWKSTQTLYNFLENTHCPINKDGFIQCYKAVRSDWTDKHTAKISNKPGSVVKMERRLISDDPDQGCHVGLHSGSVEYVKGFANGYDDRIVEVLVNPAHVVCVPNDCSFGKMRVEEYTVVREVDKNSLVQPTNQVYEDDEEFDEYA